MIIDLGCGPERERWFSGAIGVDLNADLRDPHQRHVVIEDVREGIPFPNNVADMILARHSLRYMYDNTEGLSNLLHDILGVLKPNGALLVIDYPELFNEDLGDYEDVGYKRVKEVLDEVGNISNQEAYLELRTEVYSDFEYVWLFQKVEVPIERGDPDGYEASA